MSAQILTLEKLKGLKWESFQDEIIKTKVSYLGPFCESTNVENNSVMIFSEVKRKDQYSAKKTVHEVRIMWGKYGESGIIKEFTDLNISEVKKQAIKLVENAINKGETFLY